MKKETIEKIEDEIYKKTTMPENLKGNVRKEIFYNILLAIGIIVYFIFIVLGSLDSTKVARSIDLKIFSLLLLFISIILFEVAYKKDSGKLAITGVEILIISIITLFLPYIVFELDSKHQKYYILSSSAIAIYYIIKSIIISSKAKSLYEKQESDIKELTKKENKKTDILDEEIEEDIDVDTQFEPKQNKMPKRRGRPKKEKIIAIDKEQKPKMKKKEEKNVKVDLKIKPKENETAKKRGRPKKENTKEIKKEENKKTAKTSNKKENKIKNDSQNDTKENKPKKRGRPRKVVNN